MFETPVGGPLVPTTSYEECLNDSSSLFEIEGIVIYFYFISPYDDW